MTESELTVIATTPIIGCSSPAAAIGIAAALYPLAHRRFSTIFLKVARDSTMASTTPDMEVDAVTTLKEIQDARKIVNEVYVDEKIRDYIVNLIAATRHPSEYKLKIDQYLQFGASPRATISLTLAAKAWAIIQGRTYVVPQDIKEIGMDVLRHRVIPSYEAEAEDISSEDLVQSIFEAVPVP